MKLNLDKKITILLKIDEIVIKQMADIKKEEMEWLKIFLIFYGALIVVMIRRWLPSQGINFNCSVNEVSLMNYVIWISFSATIIFLWLFINRRHSYFNLSNRLYNIRNSLWLFDRCIWKKQIYSDDHRLHVVRSFGDWWNITKPHYSFTTRIIYIIGSNFVVDLVIYKSHEWVGKPESHNFLCQWILLNLILVCIIGICDYYHFKKRRCCLILLWKKLQMLFRKVN